MAFRWSLVSRIPATAVVAALRTVPCDEWHLTGSARGRMLRDMATNERERTYAERRAAHLARLTDHGVARETADRAISDWEREATARGLDPSSEVFWAGAEEWIVAHRQR